MRSSEASFRGPGWGDVRDYLAALSERWGGRWVCSIRVPAGTTAKRELWIVCERFGVPDKSGVEKARRAGHRYPTSDGVSMPALMHGMLADVERQLQDDEGVAERQAAF